MLLNLLNSTEKPSLMELIVMLVGYLAVIFVMLPVHELAHAFVADKLGDQTARWHGRLRLNPLAHLDPIGVLMILVFGVGYARPVPVNSGNFRNPKVGMALTALAGPVSNLLMAALSLGLFRIIHALPVSYEVWFVAKVLLFDVLAWINVCLAVFNLLPIPPLDGSRILALIVPERWAYTLERYSRYFIWAIMLLLFSNVLDGPLYFLQNTVFNFLCTIFGF